MIITVDGPAAAGKGTIARSLALHFGYHFLDTGSLYRRVGLALHRRGLDGHDEAAAAGLAACLDSEPFVDSELRTEVIAHLASLVASIPAVRVALLDYQRQFSEMPPGAVLDGRDTGTVVCPAAEAKLFVTARPEVRASRRTAELKAVGQTVEFEAVLQDVLARDARDSSRAVAPLLPAADAMILDTSDLNADEALAQAITLITRHAQQPSGGR